MTATPDAPLPTAERPGGPAGGPLVVLVGPPASGKTTVMRALARHLGVPQRDTDDDVEATAGTTVAAIFAEHGEPHFRALEREAVALAVAEHDGVLALGGGAVTDPATRALLRELGASGALVVFLDVDPRHVEARIARDTTRPLLAGDALARWTTLAEQRRPLYVEVATVHVRTGGRPPAAVVADVLAHLETRTTEGAS